MFGIKYRLLPFQGAINVSDTTIHGALPRANAKALTGLEIFEL